MKRLAIVAAAIAVAAVSAEAGQTEAAPAEQFLVMPFDRVTRDARIFWIGEGAAILLADDLNSLGAHAITHEERRQAFEQLQVPPVTELTDATVIRLGQLVGASQVVIGRVDLANDILSVHARSIALEAGRVQVEASEQGPLPELFAIFERVARRLAPSVKSAGEAARPHPPVAAFENYVKGLLAETPATAIGYLNTALTLHAGFDRARLALWEVFTEQGEHQRALAAVQPVASDSAWARRARFLSGLSQLRLKKYVEAFATFKALADAQPTAAVLNNLGVVQLQRPATPQAGRATYYFNRAAEADSEDPDYFFNLGYAYWFDRDPGAAIYWLREAVRRNPGDGDAHFVLGAALAMTGDTHEAAREKDLARRLASTYDAWEKRPSPDAVPTGLERVKSDIELPRARRVGATLATSEQREQRELAQFYVDRGRRLFVEERDQEAAAEIGRALFVSPYQPEAHLLLGRIHLRNGRVREAIDALKISIWSAETAEAHVVLGEAYLQAKELPAARAEGERALALAPASAAARQLLDRIEEQ
jgi:tetratricopeptide (TPR) repeat protein